ncbi:zinc finger protein 318 isoform X1 [Xenopus tropicalis]|uniref:Zinc finger protein 318 n=1 Tax=Xenopus tropicalis TaxID=8364 RepID=A0A6I8SKN1_XENTR|nr:zinc finger protein 318 isoform X1 [Xenopus tropicalis]XP_004914881.2 zinc finger protein 318 isoform X1 [Xenopus tropicalis]
MSSRKRKSEKRSLERSRAVTMYRTPMRPRLSPDLSPEIDTPRRESSPDRSSRSWSRGRSPGRRRSRSRGRSRSRPRRSRSRSRSRSRGRSHRSGRSRSRPRRSRSRSPYSRRRSPSPYSRRGHESQSHSYKYERESSDLRRYSPSYRSDKGADIPSSRADPLQLPPEHPSLTSLRATEGRRSSAERSPDIRGLGSGNVPDNKMGIYQGTTDSQLRPGYAQTIPGLQEELSELRRPLEEPLPMPKSILKKRADPEQATGDPKQAAGYLNNKDIPMLGSFSSSEPSGDSAGRPVVPQGAIGKPIQSDSLSTNRMNIPTVAPTGSNSGPSLSENKASGLGNKNGSQLSHGHKMEDFLFSSDAMKLFSDAANSYKTAERKDSFLPYEPPKDQAKTLFPVPDKVKEPMAGPKNQRNLSEVDDEELFLYGDEEVKKPNEVSSKTAPAKTPPTPPANNSNTQEFEKIHDLLKTIGLDIGVAEIGKLAVRTQERLHGKKPAPPSAQPVSKQPPQGASKQLPQAASKQSPVATSNQPPQTASQQPLQPVPSQPSKQPPVSHQLAQKPSLPAPPQKPELQHSAFADSGSKTAVSVPGAKVNEREPQSPRKTNQVPMPIPVVKEKAPPVPAPKVEIPVPATTANLQPEPAPPPISPSPITMYSPYPPPAQMVPGYGMPPSVPPPNYNPYSPYVAYPTSSWSMYGQIHAPAHIPPPSHMVVPPVIPNLTRGNLRIIETKGDIKVPGKSEASPSSSAPATLTPTLVKPDKDRRNKEAEKMKVLDELEAIKKEQSKRKESLNTLVAKVEQLRLQQGVLLRKKQREKYGHKDPLLEELNSVLDSAQKQIKALDLEIAEANKKQQQLSKVAEILGIKPPDLAEKHSSEKTFTKKEKSRSPPSPARSKGSDSDPKSTSDSKGSSSKTSSDPPTKDWEKHSSDVGVKYKDVKHSSESRSRGSSSSSSSSGKADRHSKHRSSSPRSSSDRHGSESKKSSSQRSRGEKSKSKSPRPSQSSASTAYQIDEKHSFDLSELFEYYDGGSHWCEKCSSVHITLVDFLLHLHGTKHAEASGKKEKRPWAKDSAPKRKQRGKQTISLPFRGTEFLLPTNAYYCELCDELFADQGAVEGHIKSFGHNNKYKKHTEDNPTYERVRQEMKKTSLASLAAIQETERKQQIEPKRKVEEIGNDINQENKSKKSKKDEEESHKRKPNEPVKSEPKQSAKPEKEIPAKTPTFGKFTWKAPECKSQTSTASASASTASKVESPVIIQEKPKEEESNGPPAKQKAIEIKLLGKPATSQGSGWPSSSSKLVTSTSPTSITPGSLRPNLPIPMAVLRKTSSTAPVSKPAPLNTFLSIKSSSSSSKPLPVLKSKPEGVLPQEVISKAFGGQQVILKETDNKQEENPNKSEPETKKASEIIPDKNAENVKTPTSSNEKETPNLYDVFSNKPEPNPSKKLVPYSPDRIDLKSIGPSNEQKKVECPPESSKTPLVPEKATGTSIGKTVPLSSSTSKDQNDPKMKDISLGSSGKPLVQVPSSVAAPSTTGSNSNTGKTEYKSVSGSSSAAKKADTPSAASKEKDVTVPKPSESKQSTPVPKSSTNPSKPSDTKPSSATVTSKSPSASKAQPKSIAFPISTAPKMLPAKPGSSYSSTTQLNQKFKRAPLSLPTSLFGHVSDFARNEIKITSTVAQHSSAMKERDSVKPPEPPTQVKKQPIAAAKPEVSKKLQDELDSYYKLISTEDDPEDLTTSEDQDMVAMEEATVTPTPVKVEAPAKRVVSEIPKLTVPTVTPAAEDVDDSDMGCEDAPEAPDSSSYPSSSIPNPVYGHGFSSFSYGARKPLMTATKYSPKPFYATGQLDKVPSNKVDLPVVDCTTEEDLLTTCDESD